MKRTPFLLLALFTSLSARADYAWIAKPSTLQVRTGVDIYSTGSNFGNDGTLDVLRYLGQVSTLRDLRFWVHPEIGIDKGWAVAMALPFVSGEVTSDAIQNTLAGGSGLGDLRLALKWEASESPLVVLESEVKFPTGKSSAVNNGELAVGEGNLDLALRAHWGYQTGQFYFSASPGLLLRTGGYSSAATLDGAMQAFIRRAYIKIFLTSMLSFSPQALTGSNLTAQTVSGSGGSYARLAASPTYLTGGANVGVVISKMFRLEGGFQRSILGARAPDFVSFTVNLLGTFDLSSPDYRPKVREVPFETETLDF